MNGKPVSKDRKLAEVRGYTVEVRANPVPGLRSFGCLVGQAPSDGGVGHDAAEYFR